MPRGIRRWLMPPIIPDAKQTRIAERLNLMILGLIVVVLLDAELLLAFAPETLPTFWMNGVVVIAACVLRWLVRRGAVRLSGGVFCFLLWPITVYYLAISGDLQSPAPGFLPCFIFVEFILFDAPGAIAFGLLDTVAASSLYLAGRNGLLMSIERSPTLSRLFDTNSSVGTGSTFHVVFPIRTQAEADAANRLSIAKG